MPEYVISVDDAHRDELAQVAERLRAARLEVLDVLPHLGVVAGRASEDDEPALAAVPGVASVERSRDIGPG